MILTHCRLVPELSGGIASEDGSVTVENGKITAVSPLPAPEGIDCGGRTLLPGMFDLHTHITGLINYNWHDQKEILKHSQSYLEYGFTTLRDCGCFSRCVHAVRNLINSGEAIGPRILSSGLILSPTEVPQDDGLAELYSLADGADENLKAARREVAEGADFIKIMASGSGFHPTSVPKQPIMLPEELDAVMKVSRLKETYVAAHAHSDAAIRMCIESGVRTIEHATYISEETLKVLLETENCWLVPTFAAMYISIPDEDGFWARRLGAMLESCAENIRRAYLAGVKLGFGTDSAAGQIMYDKGMEFRYRSENCGMKAVDILLQATVYSAEIAGLAEQTGTIKAGLDADLILVDGKPDKDISVMYGKPARVWVRGEEYRKAGEKRE